MYHWTLWHPFCLFKLKSRIEDIGSSCVLEHFRKLLIKGSNPKTVWYPTELLLLFVLFLYFCLLVFLKANILSQCVFSMLHKTHMSCNREQHSLLDIPKLLLENTCEHFNVAKIVLQFGTWEILEINFKWGSLWSANIPYCHVSYLYPE